MADIGNDHDPNLVDLDEGKPLTETDPSVVELREAEDTVSLPRHAIERPDGTIELPLQHPVTLKFKKGAQVREESFETLLFHPLTGADMRVITAQPPDAITPTAIARSTRIHEGKMNAVYDRLDARDAVAAQACVMHFLGGGRPTGR
jgi:hypothetical protein